MASPNRKINQLLAASALYGDELVPVFQGEATKRTTAGAIVDLLRYGTALDVPFFSYGTGKVLPATPLGGGVDLKHSGWNRIIFAPDFAVRFETDRFEFSGDLNLRPDGNFLAQSLYVALQTKVANTVLFEGGYYAPNTTIRPYSASNSVVIEPTAGAVSAAHSTLHTWGSVALGSITWRTLALPALTNLHRRVIYNTSGGDITQALPDAANLDGREYKLFKPLAANTLTITPPSGQGDPITLASAGAFVHLFASNGLWFVEGIRP